MSLTLVGAALTFALILMLLREMRFNGAPVVAAASAVLLLFHAVKVQGGEISRLFSFIPTAGEEVMASMLKITGLSYLYGIASEVCTSLGEGTLARAVETVGRVEMFLVALPYLLEILRLGAELL